MAERRESAEAKDLRLRTYRGPYDYRALQRSRIELQSYVSSMMDTAVWWKIGKKTTINVDGDSQVGGGFGLPATVYSHGDLPNNRDSGEPYQGIYGGEFEHKRTPQVQKSSVSATSQSGDSGHSNSSNENGNAVVVINDEINDSSVIELQDSDDSCVITGEEVDLTTPRKRKYAEVDSSLDVSSVQNKNCKFDFEHITDSQTNAINGEQDLRIVDSEGNLIVNEESKGAETLDEEGNSVAISDTKLKVDEKQTATGLFLRCDLCTFKCKNRKDMQQHLNTEVHFTASEYMFTDNEVYLDKKMVLFNFEAKYKTVLVICPDTKCGKVFPQVHQCAQHFSQDHSTTGALKYGLLKVTKEEECYTNKGQKCKICNSANKNTAITDNLNKCGHYPYSIVDNCEQILFCKYCSTNFQSLDSIKQHLNLVHQKSRDSCFKVFHYREIENHEIHVQKTASRCLEAAWRTCKKGREVSTVGSSLTVTVTTKSRPSGSQSSPPESIYNIDNLFVIDRTPATSSTTGLASENILDEGSNSSSADINASGDNKKLTETYKCDFCSFMTMSVDSMSQHLHAFLHYAASTVLVDSKDTVVHIRKPASVTVKDAKFKKVAAACLEKKCIELFETVHMCYTHSVHMHNSRELSYGLAYIITFETIPVPLEVRRMCLKCGIRFQEKAALIAHQTEFGHNHLGLVANCRTYTLCSYCDQIFSVFNTAWFHVKKKHESHATDGHLDLVVLYVDNNIEKHVLPPYEGNEFGKDHSINRQISDLQRMKGQYGKKGKRKLQKQIRNLKQFLPSTGKKRKKTATIICWKS